MSSSERVLPSDVRQAIEAIMRILKRKHFAATLVLPGDNIKVAQLLRSDFGPKNSSRSN
jgi:hypothetical protein